MATKRELEIRLAAAQEEFARYDERLSHLADIRKKLEDTCDRLRVAQTDADYFKYRVEAAEQRVAELEALLSGAVYRAIDGEIHLVLPGAVGVTGDVAMPLPGPRHVQPSESAADPELRNMQ